jgi:hypothetical protein
MHDPPAAMTKHSGLLIFVCAGLAACADPTTVSPGPAACHSLKGSAFSATASLTSGGVLVVVQLQGDDTDQFTSQFTYGIPTTPGDAGSVVSDQCLIAAPFGSIYLNASRGTTAVNLPVACEDGFADGTTSLNLTIGPVPEVTDGGTIDGGTYVACDGTVQPVGPTVPVQIAPAQ